MEVKTIEEKIIRGYKLELNSKELLTILHCLNAPIKEKDIMTSIKSYNTKSFLDAGDVAGLKHLLWEQLDRLIEGEREEDEG